jgi:hypothetical protein
MRMLQTATNACYLGARLERRSQLPKAQDLGILQVGMYGTDFIFFIQLQLRDIPKNGFLTQVRTLVVLIVYFLLVAFKHSHAKIEYNYRSYCENLCHVIFVHVYTGVKHIE